MLPKLMIIKVGIAACVLAIVAGCGQSSAQTSGAAGKMTHENPATQLRTQLNAMSVPDRLAYLKQHKGAVQTMSGGSPPIHLPPQSAGGKAPGVPPSGP